jgi:hypothetical protein
MINLTDNQLRKLASAFACLDFSQPKAHEMYRMLESILEQVIITTKTTDREFRYYKLGEQTAFAQQKFSTIPPVTSYGKTVNKEEIKK